jgi:hypothetical protein
MKISAFSKELTQSLTPISKPLLYKLLEIQKVANNFDDNKADKVDSPTVDNIAVFDADGNVKDSGKDIPDGAILGSSSIGSDYGLSITDNENGTVTINVKRQSHLPDAGAVSGLTLNTGSDHVDLAAFNTALAGLVTEVNAIRNVLNNLIARLESAEMLEVS